MVSKLPGPEASSCWKLQFFLLLKSCSQMGNAAYASVLLVSAILIGYQLTFSFGCRRLIVGDCAHPVSLSHAAFLYVQVWPLFLFSLRPPQT